MMNARAITDDIFTILLKKEKQYKFVKRINFPENRIIEINNIFTLFPNLQAVNLSIFIIMQVGIVLKVFLKNVDKWFTYKS